MLGKPPPIVTQGPWRSAEPAKRKDQPVLSTVLETLLNLDGLFDLAGWLFVILRFVGHVVIIALHAVFHV